MNPRLFLVRFSEEGKKFKVHYFLERYRDKESLRLLEGQDLGWFKMSELKRLKIRPSHVTALKKSEKAIKK